jgi:hypothetical protein
VVAMEDYDAKDAWLVVDGKRIFGLGSVDFHLAKDNSKENQDRLRDNFKYAQSEPIPTKRTIEFYVEVHFKNGKTINIKMPEPNKFIDWVTERDLSKM